MVKKHYEEEMAKVRAKPLWDKFDGPMRAALRYKAKERAIRQAQKEFMKNDPR